MMQSGPARGLWIEMSGAISGAQNGTPSGPARGLWIEISTALWKRQLLASGPARGLWIEIVVQPVLPSSSSVGPRKGPVD